MRYAIDIGHNCPPDTGAVGIKKEDSLTYAVGIRVIAMLKDLGHQIINTLPERAERLTESLAKRCDTANKGKADLFVSIHFNCYDSTARGTEVFVGSEKGRPVAQCIIQEIAKLGFSNRGVKTGNFYVLKNTNMPAVLVEVCFIDSEWDVDILKLVGIEAIAQAIVKGLTGKLPAKPEVNVA
jgi:N-acetylmuramoyl-L-alanine amidase